MIGVVGLAWPGRHPDVVMDASNICRNTSTGETRWERPTAEDAPPAPTTAAAAAAAAKAEAAAQLEEKKEDNNGLPPGWKEVKHAATGQVRACSLYLTRGWG